jgi:hypothetical protein
MSCQKTCSRKFYNDIYFFRHWDERENYSRTDLKRLYRCAKPILSTTNAICLTNFKAVEGEIQFVWSNGNNLTSGLKYWTE